MFDRRSLQLALLLLVPAIVVAQPIPVLRTQGTMRGFVLLRSEAGAALGYGEFVQVAHDDRVTLRVTLRFRDGSLDDETAVYTQHKVFQLVTDHHVQRGPFFAKPLDLTIHANGDIVNRTLDRDGKPSTETSHIDLPDGTTNGLLETILVNIRPNSPEFKLPMIVPAGKGRLIQLAVTSDGEGSFSCIAGSRRRAAIFRIKPELGGIAGVVAPLIGKQPADTFVWVLEGDAPAIVRVLGQLAEGGPVVSIELAGAIFSHTAAPTPH